jgi:tellurite resistance protein TerC
VFVLAYIGVKMLLAHSHPILGVGLFASVVGGDRDTAALRSPVTHHQLGRTTLSVAWKAVILVVGGTVLALGAAMIVLPGPALLVIPLGLMILATQFLWARRFLERVRKQIRDGVTHVRDDMRTMRERHRRSGP